jgi:anaerobic selenocysteine-containing dehydrogenase
MSKLSRRLFMTTAPAAAAAVVSCKSGPAADPFALAKHKPPAPGTAGKKRNQEEHVSSICGQCPAGCGITVRVVEGRAVKIDGNPAFPVNKGSLGPKGQAGVEVLYHRDRLKGPMRRVGERGQGKFKEVSWEEAIAEVGAKLKAQREGGESRGLVLLDGQPRGAMHEWWGRFLESYGSPNHVDHRSTTDGGTVLAMLHMQGVADLPAYDWARTRYVLGMGSALFESWCQSIHATRAASKLRHGVPGNRVKFVHVSPRYSPTAIKADEWVPIRPATYGALALGLAHVLVKEKKHDEAFLTQHSFGFEDFKDAKGLRHKGFKTVLTQWEPKRVESVTGIPEATVVRLAHELADYRPAIVLADGGAAAATNGLGTAMAIHALNAVLGNLERPGGLLVQRPPPLQPWKELSLDATARTAAAQPRLDGAGGERSPLGHSNINALPEAMLAGKPYAASAVFFFQSNPFFSKPGGAQWVKALHNVPLVVSFSPLPDESTLHADWVLPDLTYLERNDLVVPAPSLGVGVAGWRQPAVPPQVNGRHTGDVVLGLARAIGGSVAEAFPQASYLAALVERLRVEGTDEADAILDDIKESGGRWDKGDRFEDWAHAFATPSGKFELYSQRAAQALATLYPIPSALEATLKARGVTTAADELCLPHWEPANYAGDAQAYPLVVLPYRAMNYAEGGVRHQKRLSQMPLVPGVNPGRPRIEINPVDAQSLGLANGDRALVETPAGSQALHVMIHRGIRPGTLGLPLGLGTWPPRQGETTGGYQLLSVFEDPLAGIFAANGTRARVRRLS